MSDRREASPEQPDDDDQELTQVGAEVTEPRSPERHDSLTLPFALLISVRLVSVLDTRPSPMVEARPAWRPCIKGKHC